jgi:diaminohydroxyphosphoribosylaminopyrimidine deaminase/5-amino-6-(5-phosphoribosylamino)uracil reductase
MPTDDDKYMARAFELAERGLGVTSPNPAVGAVVVAGGEIVGEGHHEQFGGPHAEINAMKAAGDRVAGSTVYVTLEPCSHEGKTPPCAKALIDAKVGRVVYSTDDPNPEAAGGGEVLSLAGIDVEAGVLAERGRAFYSYFYKHVRASQSYVIGKWAMTADGRIASRTGDSRWVTSDESRKSARRLRSRCDVVMVGIGTILRDDPRLTARSGDRREPLRVIVDSSLRTPPSSEIFNVAGGVVVIACSESASEEKEAELRDRGAEFIRVPAPGGRVKLESVLEELHERGKLRILIEGGATLLGAAFDAKRVDEVCVFMAPKIIGGKQSPGAVSGRGITKMTNALQLEDARFEPSGPDILLRGRIGAHDWME